MTTEDLAFMLERMGVDTGLDVPALLALRQRVAGWLSGEILHGTLWQAGIPKTPAAGAPAGTAFESNPSINPSLNPSSTTLAALSA